MAFPLALLLPILNKVFDRVLPDQEAKDKAHLDLAVLMQQGDLQELETRMSAIVMEAKSADPWTSRARPSFMYVIYIFILSAIPMGFLFAFNPAVATDVIKGVQGWLEAIPESMWTTFTVGYLGYAGARSFDKLTVIKGTK